MAEGHLQEHRPEGSHIARLGVGRPGRKEAWVLHGVA